MLISHVPAPFRSRFRWGAAEVLGNKCEVALTVAAPARSPIVFARSTSSRDNLSLDEGASGGSDQASEKVQRNVGSALEALAAT